MSAKLPGPRTTWMGMNLVSKFRNSTLDFLQELGRDFGDFAYFKAGPFGTCFVNHPDLIRQVLVTDAKVIPKSERLMKVLKQIDGTAVATSEGELWKRQRRLVQPAFQHQRMPSYATTMRAAAEKGMERWKTKSTLDLNVEVTHLTLEIICKTLFDVDIDGRVSDFAKAVHLFSEVFIREVGLPFLLPDWVPLPYKRKKVWAMKTLDRFIWQVVRERRASGLDKGDLLSKLILSVDDEANGKGMTDEQVRNEAMTLFNAGHDTTAAALTWVFYLIAKHPDVQNKILEETKSGNLSAMPFTERVIKETLRLYPPAYVLFGRESIADIKFGEHLIPKKTTFLISPFVTQRDPRFFENPETFDPERFAPEREGKIPRFAYLPFGLGPHVCIGSEFATMEMKILIPSAVRRFEMSVVKSSEGLLPLLSLRPKGGIELALKARAS